MYKGGSQMTKKRRTKVQTNEATRKEREIALAKYLEENPEILQALDAMKRAQLAKSVRSHVHERYAYQSLAE